MERGAIASRFSFGHLHPLRAIIIEHPRSALIGDGMIYRFIGIKSGAPIGKNLFPFREPANRARGSDPFPVIPGG
jgi:hypothetical protein